MFDYGERPSTFSVIKIGRITYGVFVFLSWAIFVHLLFSHPADKAEGLGDMLMGMIMFLIDTVLTIIGLICSFYFYLKAQNRQNRFWILATGAAALPLVLTFVFAVW
jgi:membrane protease YdiL (CAAX protease family)